MFKSIRSFERAILSAMLPLITILFSFQAVNGEYYNESFRVYDEMRLSSMDMDCNYFLEDYQRRSFNFEYPKLIIGEDETPLVIFIDEKSQQLIFTEIKNGSSSTTNIIPSFGKHLWEFKWPIIFIKNNIIHLALIENGDARKRKYRIRILTLDKKNSVLSLQKEISITNGKPFDELNSRDCLLSRILPYGAGNNDFFIHGRFTKVHFHLLGLTSGHFPTFDKNFSVIGEGNEVGQFETIDEKGKFTAGHCVYTVSDSGIANAAWIRRWINFSSEHDEAICFSQKSVGAKWTKPRELFIVKDTSNIQHLSSLSMTNYENSTFLLWQDIEKGIYFVEIKEGIQEEVTQISDMKNPSNMGHIEPLWGASTTKISVDRHGNVYALWVLNSNRKHQILLTARINGKWTETVVVNSGPDVVKLPDMKVDENGFIHIAYLKGSITNIACYYTKLKLKRPDQHE